MEDTLNENPIVEYCRQNKVAIFFGDHEEFLKLHLLFGVDKSEAIQCGPLETKWENGVCSFTETKENKNSKATTIYRCSGKESAYYLRGKDHKEWITMQARDIIELAENSIAELVK